MSKFSTTITELGFSGDGVAFHEGKKLFIPRTLPGEEITARIVAAHKDYTKAELVTIQVPSPERREAPCPHFSHCGGCSLQHVQEAYYYAFKQQIVTNAVKRAGFDEATIMPLVRIGAGSRRRASFKVAATKNSVRLGYFEEHSHRLIDINACLVLEESIHTQLLPLKKVIASLTVNEAISEVSVSLSDTGLDILFHSQKEPELADLELLAGFAEQQDISRIAWKLKQREIVPIVTRNPVQMVLGEVRVDIPAGSFMQASRMGQQVITTEIMQALAGIDRIVDIYAGCGTYSFPLAAHARIHAVEGDNTMVEAVARAANRHSYQRKVTVEQRDVFRFPLTKEELSAYKAVVINPPRNGAASQVAAITEGNIPIVAMVSCNPATFTRDAKSLRDAGYRLKKTIGIDQFYLTSHLEMVGVFAR